MQLVHLAKPNSERPLDNAQSAALTIARVVSCIGTRAFGTTAIRTLNSTLPLCWWSVYSLYDARPPSMHTSGSFEVPDRTAEAFESYRDGLYRTDQTFSAARRELRNGDAALTHWRADEIPAKHRGAIYTRNELRERVSLVRTQRDGALMAINLYRHESQRPFDDGELDFLCKLGTPLLACVDLHLRTPLPVSVSLPAPPATQRASFLDALPKREREVCGRLLRGWTYDGIASDLGISAATVKTYRDRAFDRLEIHHRNELFALALSEATSI